MLVHATSIAVTLMLAVMAVSAGRPNFVMVISDDLRYFDPYDDPLTVMPNIYNIVRDGRRFFGGMFFTNAHSQMPMCTPSRISIMTGLRPDATRAYGISSKLRTSKKKKTLTLPQYLKQNGYNTVMVGKIYDKRSVENLDRPYSWTKAIRIPGSSNVKSAEATNCNYGDRLFDAKKNTKPFAQCLKENDASLDAPLPSYSKNVPIPDMLVLDNALDQLERLSSDDSRRFFLAIGFIRPHIPFVAPQRYFERWPRSVFYNNTRYWASRTRDHVASNLAYGNNEARKCTDWAKAPASKPLPDELHARVVHSYLASSAFVDDLFGRIVNAVEALPQNVRANTIVIFTSDHGWHLGEHLFYGKQTAYDAASRVPLLIMGPRSMFPDRIRRSDAPVELIDVFPTVVELAGLKPVARIQGTSLVPMLKGSVSAVKGVAMSQFYSFANGLKNDMKYMSYALQGKRYRLFLWLHKNRIQSMQLYDMIQDPRETKDLSKAEPERPVLNTFLEIFRLYLKNKQSYSDAISTIYLHVD